MTRRNWLLLFVAEGEPDALDPIRIQKGLFLLAQEGALPAGERYWFVPYNYGPMSPRVYRDVDALVRHSLLERRRLAHRQWRLVGATDAGRRRARELVQAADHRELAAIERLRGIRQLVCGMDFTHLLATIYERYPAFAQRSVFRRA